MSASELKSKHLVCPPVAGCSIGHESHPSVAVDGTWGQTNFLNTSQIIIFFGI